MRGERIVDAGQASSSALVLENGDLLQGEWTENRIYRIKPDGTRSIFAEGGLDGPVGIVQRPSGDFIVANSRGEFLARIPPAGGKAEVALRHEDMAQPNGVTIDSDGNIYVSDLDGGKVFKWMPTGEIVILAELPGKGNAHAVFAGGALYVNKIWDHVLYRVELDTGAFGIVTGNGRAGYQDGPSVSRPSKSRMESPPTRPRTWCISIPTAAEWAMVRDE